MRMGFKPVMQRNGQKRDNNKSKEKNDKKKTILNFVLQKEITWTFPKTFLWCF
jgi:hypothetical protein